MVKFGAGTYKNLLGTSRECGIVNISSYFPKNPTLSNLKKELEIYRIDKNTHFTDHREEATKEVLLTTFDYVYHHVPVGLKHDPRNRARRGRHKIDFLILDFAVDGKALTVEPHHWKPWEIKVWEEYYGEWGKYLYIITAGSKSKNMLAENGINPHTFSDEYWPIEDIVLRIRDDKPTFEDQRRLKEKISERVTGLIIREGQSMVEEKILNGLTRSKRL